MEDDSPEALKRELERAGQLITELEQAAVYSDRDRARLSDGLRSYAEELNQARVQRDRFEMELRRLKHRWAMYALDHRPIDPVRGERAWPPEVLEVVAAFQGHPIGRCRRCGQVAPLKATEGAERLCAWPEGCDDGPTAAPAWGVDSCP